LRLFNPYGPHQQLNKIIPTFYFQAINRQLITVYGDGTDTRDYTYVGDIVKALVMAGKMTSGQVVNICTGRTLTNLDVAKMIKELTRSSSPIVKVGYPPLFGGIKRQTGSYSRARKLLGWEPTVSFEDGLKSTIEWLETSGSLATKPREITQT
jgi:nucleoside-diphosphate-sugar epimerase